jgi:hypothetical protein
MISANMLPQTVQIYRTVEDSTRSFIQTSEVLVGEYPCYLAQKRQPTQLQLTPQNIVTCSLELLMNLPADIKSGDRANVDGADYTIGYVRKPLNRHIQADLYLEVEA